MNPVKLNNIEYIENLILNGFPHVPTNDQKITINALARFINTKKERCALVIKGYAGTGKTTLISTIVKVLPQLKYFSTLLAPTGRAAKVMTSYSGHSAHTIHRYIYKYVTSASGVTKIVKLNNKSKNTIFIIDEASMIPDYIAEKDFNVFSNIDLLEDLINYVFKGENCKLIFIGDTAQLPPVGLEISPALNTETLTARYLLNAGSVEMKDVVRQAEDSEILLNASKLRKQLYSDNIVPKFELINNIDIVKITGNELIETLEELYSKSGLENSLIVSRSNKRANIFNQQIRNRILYREEEISAGDFLMVVKNNYFWLKDDNSSFIANGDIIEVLRVNYIKEIYNFKFANVEVKLTDHTDNKVLNLNLLLETLYADTANLPYEKSRELFENVMGDYVHITNKRKRFEELRNNEYFNALQVKFAYAVTCHKSQGGQWENIIIDQGFMTLEMIDNEYLRWLYTALTRATKRVFLLNFSNYFFE